MIALGSDHAGLGLKMEISRLLDELGLEYLDVGTDSMVSCDYPVYGRLAAEAVVDGRCDRGIIFCGTGIGISIAANKVPGIRCAVCSECFSAVLSRQHNNCNMLALGGRVVGFGLARMIVSHWLETEFEGGRHEQRVNLIHKDEGSMLE